jgi:BirA family biotin operon repressor/biotin-[acetyl-CoA-carboxylase] ligase
MIEPDTILALLRGAVRDRLDALDAFDEIGSTNAYLLEQAPPQPQRFRVALADHQSAGRGRQGHRWLSEPGSSVCLSLSYSFAGTPPDLPAVTLAVGVGVVQALERAGVRGAGLKWPNDIVVRDGKLGGILTEVHSAGSDGTSIVVGVGINVDLGDSEAFGQVMPRIGHVSDLASVTGTTPSRPELVALLIEQVVDALARFGSAGLDPFVESWQRLDWLRGQRVTIESGEQLIDGICAGIDSDGALLLNSGQSRRRILSGSVHLRHSGGGPA